MKNDKANSLSLSGLTEFDLDFDRLDQIDAEREQKQQMYKDKYGDDWYIRYLHEEGIITGGDYDTYAKSVNTAIYYGCWASVSGNSKYVMLVPKMQEDRMHELYGDKYEELKNHPAADPRIIELLIADAIKTGKWKELPDELQEEYHKRVDVE